jgi:hypothetical protein
VAEYPVGDFLGLVIVVIGAVSGSVPLGLFGIAVILVERVDALAKFRGKILPH